MSYSGKSKTPTYHPSGWQNATHQPHKHNHSACLGHSLPFWFAASMPPPSCRPKTRGVEARGASPRVRSRASADGRCLHPVSGSDRPDRLIGGGSLFKSGATTSTHSIAPCDFNGVLPGFSDLRRYALTTLSILCRTFVRVIAVCNRLTD